jgi:formylglycine-generating enzyme required for sulfatase activity
MARIFLCHASEDKTSVREIYQRLSVIEGFEPWLDEEDLLPGQIWADEIPRALKASEFILVFFSRNSVAKRGYIQREMKMALDAWEEIPGNMIHTIPVRLDECELPEPFGRYRRADLFDPRGFDHLIRSLQLGLEQRGIPKLTPLESPIIESEPPSDNPPPPAAQSHQGTSVILPDETLVIIEADTPSQTFTNSIGMEFVLTSPGEFRMGSPDSDPHAFNDEKPAHQVEISQPFYLGKYPVTQRQWEMVMGVTPSRFKGDNLPVESVSWDDVQAFMGRLNEREGVDHYRLPSEAEWEYACRAGSTGLYSFDDEVSQLGEYAWYDENSGDTTHPVGQKKPNAWGLYDMHGNVWEWVEDGKRAYTAHAITDPKGPTDAGAGRVIRGGGWFVSARVARSAFRVAFHPGYRDDYLGFRCLSSGTGR